MFRHDLLPSINVVCDDTENGRYYVIDNITRLPSVTTVLGRMLPHDYLDEWRDRVGEVEANRISKQASRRGSLIHRVAEKYILNDKNYAKNLMPVNVVSVKKLTKILDEHVSVVRGIELPLFSKLLGTAGRGDLLCEWDGVLSFVDFKTSKRSRTRDDVIGYFLQVTAYAAMARIMYGIKILQTVIVILVDHDDEPTVFVSKFDDYLEQTIKLFLDHKHDKY